jgi:hypothetical protein
LTTHLYQTVAPALVLTDLLLLLLYFSLSGSSWRREAKEMLMTSFPMMLSALKEAGSFITVAAAAAAAGR